MSELVWARQTRSGDKHPAFLIDKVSIDEATVWIKWDSNGKEELLPKSFVRSKLPKRNRSSSNTTLRGSTLEKKSSIAKCTKKSNVVASNTAMPQPRPDVPSSSVLPFLAVSAEMAPIFKEDTDDEGDPGEGDTWAPSPVKSSSAMASSEYNEDTDDEAEELDHETIHNNDSPPNKKSKTGADASDNNMTNNESIAAAVSAEPEEEFNHNWNDACLDHHFGMELDSARDSYTSRGRTDAVWKILAAYGFNRNTDTSSNEEFEGVKPHACFEYYVRKRKSRADENSELPKYRIADLAQNIRNSHLIDYLRDEEKARIERLDDRALVKEALSVNKIGRYTGLYFSFCQGDLEDSGWHCRICKQCTDWPSWHCKGCKKCQYGVSIPCEECSPKEFAHWKERTGYW